MKSGKNQIIPEFISWLTFVEASLADALILMRAKAGFPTLEQGAVAPCF